MTAAVTSEAVKGRLAGLPGSHPERAAYRARILHGGEIGRDGLVNTSGESVVERGVFSSLTTNTALMRGDNTESENEPQRSRPSAEGYGIPQSEDGMLTWDFVEDAMSGDQFYWITTVRPDGKPHARPTWGVWVGETFYCGGGERTRWVRNLSTNKDIVIHREDAEEVVIVEGKAKRIDEETASSELVAQVDAAYEKKYDLRHGTPFFAVRPEKVFAWSNYPTDATRWEFSND